jgi:hypothetical protein
MKMKLTIFAFITIVAMSSISPVNAGYFTGRDILDLCESESFGNREGCVMYLSGLIDLQDSLYKWKDLTKKYYCIPVGEDISQIQKVFIKHANKNPDKLDWTATSVAIHAFAEAFPCK